VNRDVESVHVRVHVVEAEDATDAKDVKDVKAAVEDVASNTQQQVTPTLAQPSPPSPTPVPAHPHWHSYPHLYSS